MKTSLGVGDGECGGLDCGCGFILVIAGFSLEVRLSCGGVEDGLCTHRPTLLECARVHRKALASAKGRSEHFWAKKPYIFFWAWKMNPKAKGDDARKKSKEMQ